MATVQIRNLDDRAYAVLKRRAKESGRSLQEYLRLELERQAAQETSDEAIRRIRAQLEPGDSIVTMEDIVRLQREGRDR
jgi:plasmid stability protein